ncbi:acetoin utilization AcuB family protein [Lentibacillus cibarius]|uniref:acetoin utilization AcuB family protein n=1 Tax=Lentibacillus cibarius TaxID=2583219 RepID=UPI0026C2F3C2|nr:acetoin utilization AcuB family protein [Lentibacillus cibarius]
MLVEEIMKKDVITLSPSATIANALKLLRENHIRHIPIVNQDNQVVGIVSDRDVRDATASIFNTADNQQYLQQELQSIMSYPVVTAHPLDFVEEVARVFYNEGFGCLPVVSGNTLIGIITEKEMLYTMILLTGTNIQSSQIEVKVPHKPGILPEVAAVFGKRKTNITSVLMYPFNDDPNYKILVFRIQTMNPVPLIQDLRDAAMN